MVFPACPILLAVVLGADCNHNGVPDDVDLQRRIMFDAAMHFAAGDGVEHVALGDVDLDGAVDALTVTADGLLVVLRNRGDGVLEPPVFVPAGSSGAGIALLDFDLDGDLDAVIADPAGGTANIVENVHGAFRTGPTVPVHFAPRYVAAGQIAGGPAPDLVVVRGDVAVFRNDAGVFAPLVTLPGPAARVTVIDLDLDGHGDIVALRDGGDALDVHWGREGRFVTVTYATGAHPIDFAAGDFDGDGDRDLVTANAGRDNVTFIFLDGMRGLRSDVGVEGTPTAIAAADLDRDGDRDVAVPLEGGTMRIVRHDGGGAFTLLDPKPTVEGVTDVVPADIDGDDDVDLIAASPSRRVVVVLRGTGAPAGLPAGPGIVSLTEGLSGVVARNMDLDADNDVVVINGVTSEMIPLRNFGGAFTALAPRAVGCTPVAVATGDLKNDDDIDVVTANAGDGTVSVLMNIMASMAFQPAVDYAVGPSATDVEIADLDGDGDNDIAAVVPGAGDPPIGGAVVILDNNGTGLFAIAGETAAGDGAQAVAIGRLDADTALDLVVANAGSGDVTVHRNLGDGTFATATSHAVAAGLADVVVADLTGDGLADVATVRDAGAVVNDAIAVLDGDGFGNLAVARTFAAGAGGTGLIAADLDQDGDLDLIVARPAHDDVVVLANAGNGTFGPPVGWSTGGAPGAVAVAHLRGDPRVDLAVAGGTAPGLAIHTNASLQPFSEDLDGSGVPDECEGCPAGDINGDGVAGVADLLLLLAAWGPCVLCPEDLDGDGSIGLDDVLILLSVWGPCDP